MRSISHHITPLVINSLRGGHTNKHTRILSWTEAILRNQVRAGRRLACAWFKKKATRNQEKLASKQEGKDYVPKKRQSKIIPKVCGIRNNNSTLLTFCWMMKSQKLKGQIDLGRKKGYCCLLLY